MGLRRGVGVTGRGEGQGGVRVQVGVPCTARASAEAARSAVVRRRSVRPPHASSHLVWYRGGVQRRVVGGKEHSHLAVDARGLVRRVQGACGVPEATRGCGAEYAPGARVPCTCLSMGPSGQPGCPAPRGKGHPARLPCASARTAR